MRKKEKSKFFQMRKLKSLLRKEEIGGLLRTEKFCFAFQI